MKRFWTRAYVERIGWGYVIRLDGRPMRLPGGPSLSLGSRMLAEAIADEWQLAGGAPGGEMRADDVPLTRLAGTVQERISPDPAATVDALSRFGQSDLLCYRAAEPATLADQQHAAFQPWLDWAAATLSARLRTTTGIMHVVQAEETLAALTRATGALDAASLGGLGVIVPLTGSLVLGLAVTHGALSADKAASIASVDEMYQESLWGCDAEAVLRRANMLRDVTDAGRFIALSRHN